MIAKPVVVTYDYIVDEQTNIGLCNGAYAKFATPDVENEAPVESVPMAILPVDVMNEYVAAQIRVPDEFVEVREAVQTKINALQAVL